MFKKRNVKSTSAKRRNPEDDLDSESVTSIASDNAKKQKVPVKSATHSPNEPKTPSDPPNSAQKSSQNSKKDNATDAEDPEPIQLSKKVSGPKGAPKNIRVTTLTDFQPDVCKDFQQTGYCGYGDTCKFLHIRGESKAKKPVEKEWETAGKKEEKTEEVPFRCVICKKDYTSPVKTLCGHVFCQECFMKRFRAGKSKCVICKQETGGSVQPVT